MARLGLLAVALTLALVGCGGTSVERVDNQPDWPVVSPDAEQLDAEFLQLAADALPKELPAVRSLLVARNGRLVYEQYYGNARPEDRVSTFSITKSVISALVGVALEDGKLESVDQPVGELLPSDALDSADARLKEMPLRNLLTMSAGFAPGGDEHEASDDWVASIAERPLESEPGRRFAYDNGTAHLVAAALREATGANPAEYAREKLFDPLGIEGGDWPEDPDGTSYGAGGLALNARELAKLGQLYLQEGRWAGDEIIPADYVRDSTTSHIETATPGINYGFFWWTVERLSRPWPQGSFAALGSGGQSLVVVPELDLVVVVTSDGGPTWFAGPLIETYILPAADFGAAP